MENNVLRAKLTEDDSNPIKNLANHLRIPQEY